MKTILTNVVALFVCVTLALGGLVWMTGDERTIWPDFSAISQNAEDPLSPQVVSEFDRDFGWRIGDIIPVQLYLHQKPGTVVDLHSLAVEGDFDILEQPAIVTRDFQDGSRNISIKFRIQSMSPAKKLNLKVSMLYRHIADGDDKLIAIPAFEAFTSPTWDGREIIKDGKPGFVQEHHMLWTLAYILGGFAAATTAFTLRRKFITAVQRADQKAWETRRQIARREFDEAWSRFEAGEYRVENYKAIVRCLRKLFRIESKVRREIELELGGAHPYREQTLKILEITGKVLYEERVLSREEHHSIKDLFDQIVPPEVGHRANASAENAN
jgi:hypothetical protein